MSEAPKQDNRSVAPPKKHQQGARRSQSAPVWRACEDKKIERPGFFLGFRGSDQGFGPFAETCALHWSALPPWRTTSKQKLYQPSGRQVAAIGMNLQL
jgi:hypothetical protein